MKVKKVRISRKKEMDVTNSTERKEKEMAKTTKKVANQNAETEESLLSVVIPGIMIKIASVKIVGDTPLIVHNWEEKAKQMILDKQTKKATAGKEAKDPFADFVGSLYWLSGKPSIPEFSEKVRAMAFAGDILNIEQFADAKFGFPHRALKQHRLMQDINRWF